MKIEHAGSTHDVDVEGRFCEECGTDLEWWIRVKKKKAFWIDNDDMFCSRKCFKDYCLSYWHLVEIKK
jgi:hypothetical protein